MNIYQMRKVNRVITCESVEEERGNINVTDGIFTNEEVANLCDYFNPDTASFEKVPINELLRMGYSR